MRILYIASRYTGGTGQYAVQVREMMRARGHETELLHAPSIRARNLAQPSFAFTSAVKAAFGQKRFDIVHAFGVPAAPAMRMARARRRVLTVGGVYSDQFGMIHPGPAGRAATALEPRALSWAHALTTDSASVRSAYKKKLGLDFELLLGPLEASRFEGIVPRKGGAPRVIYVGRESVEKGVGVLREAEPGIRARVVYCTSLPWREAMAELAGADVFVQPSLAESIPNATKEAQFLGVPAVGSDTGGIPEIIEHERTGLLVPPGDAGALAAAVNRLLEDRGLAERMAERARQNITAKFSTGALAPEYERFYEKVAA